MSFYVLIWSYVLKNIGLKKVLWTFELKFFELKSNESEQLSGSDPNTIEHKNT